MRHIDYNGSPKAVGYKYDMTIMITHAKLLMAHLYANQLCSERSWGGKRPIIILFFNYNERVKCKVSGIVLLCILILQKK